MAGETFLLSGDQIGSYASASGSWPPPTYTVTVSVTGITPLGSASDRFFLVRTQGSGDPIQNGDLFQIYTAVDNGSGTLVPGTALLNNLLNATPDGYERTVTGDTFNIFGVFGSGPKYIINLNGFNGATTFTVARGNDVAAGGDGEMSLADITAANPDAVVCFVSGTMIDTRKGSVPVETLKVGDEVLTLDHGFRPIRWIGRSQVHLSGPGATLQPVRFRKDCFGPGFPDRDVLVSPAHRLLLEGWRMEMLFAEPQVLVPAKFLVNGRTVVRETRSGPLDYWHFMFDRHEVVYSSGLPSESFHPATYGVSTLGRAAREELLRLFPGLAFPGRGGELPATCRYSLKRYEARALRDLTVAGTGGRQDEPVH